MPFEISSGMIKIEAFIQPFKLADVRAALQDFDVVGIAISEVSSQGGSSRKVVYRGAEYCAECPMTKIELLTSSLQVDEVVEAISRVARTDSSWDDGTILIYEVADAIKIRTRERVELAYS
jgi:nitrogen regulatory protein PII